MYQLNFVNFDSRINIDPDLRTGLELLNANENLDHALKLINKSARKGISKGKSFFVVGTIIKNGMIGLEASVSESKGYFDKAMVYFLKDENLDCLDYLYMGDYYFYGLGSENKDVMKAKTYYEKSYQAGNKEVKERLDKIEQYSSGFIFDLKSNSLENDETKFPSKYTDEEIDNAISKINDFLKH